MDEVIKAAVMGLSEIAASAGFGIAARRMAAVTWCAALAAVFAAASAGCAVTALWVVVSPELGPVGALLIAAAAFLLLCLSLLAMSRNLLRRRPASLRAAAVHGSALPALLAAAASHLLDKSKGAGLLVALLAGATAGSGVMSNPRPNARE